MAFVSLLGVVIAHGYIITQVAVSKQCGPFRGHAFMFETFIEGILALKEVRRVQISLEKNLMLLSLTGSLVLAYPNLYNSASGNWWTTTGNVVSTFWFFFLEF